MSAIDRFYKIDLRHDGDFVAAPNGDFALAKGVVNLKQALFNRLVTVKGSLVHRPEYGVGVQMFQGAISSIAKQRELAVLIKEQFERDERVDKVTGVKFESLKEDGSFQVTYKVQVSGDQLIDETVNPFGDVEI